MVSLSSQSLQKYLHPQNLFDRSEGGNEPIDPLGRPEENNGDHSVLSLAEQPVWEVWKVLSRRDKQVANRLQSKTRQHDNGLEQPLSWYVPTFEEQRHYKSCRSKRKIDTLALPGCVSVRGTSDDLRTASAWNVRDLQVGYRIKVVEQERFAFELEQVYRLINSGEPLTAVGRLIEGEKVCIQRGALEGTVGIYNKRIRNRIHVLCHLMGTGVSVEINECDIKPYS